MDVSVLAEGDNVVSTLVDNVNYSATVIADSKCDGKRLTSLAVTFPRFILPEFNTHRVFSRNSASSRARSKKVTIREVMENPFIPEPFTGDKRGMVGTTQNTLNQQFCVKSWLEARNQAVKSFLALTLGRNVSDNDVKHYSDIEIKPNEGVHKQHANRLIEPFMWHTVLVTADMWKNFFKLRLASDAQPEIYKTALVMKHAIDNSLPENTDTHLPFMKNEKDKNLLVSVARCARVSYKLYDGSISDQSKDEKLAETLLANGHMSPFEHVAFNGDKAIALARETQTPISRLRGNFKGWVQYRKLVEIGAASLV